MLKRLRDGHLGISFVPQEVGEHLVHVPRGGQPLPRSPLAVTISQAELGDASRVQLRGPGLSEGTTFQPAQFTIDTRQAGSPFSVKVTGEGRVRESITRRRRAPPEASVGTPCDLSLKMPELS
ncbi:filamin-A-like, partial [Onychostruthus taczanowskii]|uniref:filamin-A-like n=1 Tax=Onychostruthus taczanowskii TaxID=356909 RepID=UPI001B804F3C